MSTIRLAWVSAALLAAAAPAAGDQAGHELSFGTPAQVGPDLNASAEWVFMSLAPSTSAMSFDAGRADLVTYTRMYATAGPGEVNGSMPLGELPGNSNPLGPIAGTISFPDGYASLYLEGDIKISVRDATAVLQGAGTGWCVDEVLNTREHDRRDARDDAYCPGEGGVVVSRNDFGQSMAVAVEATSLTLVEWHHGVVNCTSQSCPPGGQRSSTDASSPLQGMVIDSSEHVNLATTTGSFAGQSNALTLVFGGPGLNVAVDGGVRLPQVETASLCPACDSNQTLRLYGKLELAHLRPIGNARMGATVSGDVSKALVDEVAIPAIGFSAKDAALVATGAAATLIVAKISFSLFLARNKSEKPDPPNRRRVFDYVAGHPGATYREIVRETGLANGTTQHHVSVLVQSKRIVERPLGQSKRYFAELKADWLSVALLRDQPLKDLHDWIQLHPRSTQGELLQAMERDDWSRSTTQHRLARLVREGLVECYAEGRYKRYLAVHAVHELQAVSPAVSARSA